MSKDKIPMPEVTSSEIAYQGYFDVVIDQVKAPHHPTRISYTQLNLKAHAAAVIAKTKEGLFVVTQEYRHPLRKWVTGCPGGRIDLGESPIEAGKRELLEETGYTGGTYRLLGEIYPLPAVTNQKIFYILAEGVAYAGPPALEPLELIRTELKTKEEILALIHAGEAIDGIFCTGLLLLN